MPVQIGAKLDSGFDDPLGMLQDCHRRIERFLAILCDLAERAHARALTSEEASAIRGALAYFREGGRRHTADEEESLFPRMRTLAPPGTLDPLDHLEDDHREADQLHDDVDRLYSGWLAAGPLNPHTGTVSPRQDPPPPGALRRTHPDRGNHRLPRRSAHPRPRHHRRHRFGVPRPPQRRMNPGPGSPFSACLYRLKQTFPQDRPLSLP
jgi:hypothetical protein